ncbi:hypothetical protein FB451DRAFT_1553359 [Mycena latifolia]|nr:hypothetical protein FB451DRAFT_1553359 [Mycena latifolia]
MSALTRFALRLYASQRSAAGPAVAYAIRLHPSRTAFVSGPLAPTSAYFQEHYLPKLEAAIAQGDAFVLGPDRGVAALALEYLRQHGVVPSRVTVFLTEPEAAQPQLHAFADGLRAQGVKVVVAGAGHTERDAAMTAASDYNILTDGGRVSGAVRGEAAPPSTAATKTAVPSTTRTAFISGPLAPHQYIPRNITPPKSISPSHKATPSSSGSRIDR